jgi:hypothetical protein
MLAIFASADIAVQAIEGTSAVWVDGIIVKKPGIASLGLIKN